MSLISHLVKGTLAQIDTLAYQTNTVLWVRSADHSRILYISESTYQKTWGRSCVPFYTNPKLLGTYCMVDDPEKHWDELHSNRISAIDNHTELFEFKAENNDIKLVYARSFKIKDKQGNLLAFAGVNLPIEEKDSLKTQIEIEQLLDKVITQFYNLLSDQELTLASNMDKKLIATLSKREQEVLSLILSGFSISNIANELELSPRTVDTYIERIKNKLVCENKSEIIMKAIEKGWLNISI